MKKFVMALLASLCVVLTPLAYAQPVEPRESLKTLAINAMLEYGVVLFDRKDYRGAASVFLQVLFYDSINAQSRNYLQKIKDQGLNVYIPGMPKRVNMPEVAQIPTPIPLTPKIISPELKPAKAQLSAPVLTLSDEEYEAYSQDVTEEVAEEIIEETDPQIEEDLAQLQGDLHRMGESLHENTQKLEALEQQVP